MGVGERAARTVAPHERSTDPRLLRSLVALADEGHVGRAASRLHLTQPALTKQLAQLERSTGLILFDRHPRGIRPTEVGRLLIDRARHVLRELDDFDVLAARSRRSVTGRLALGFVGQAANELTPQLLRTFRAAHPEVTVELRQYDMRDLTAGLAGGASDLAILRLPVTAPTGLAGLRHEPLLVEPRVAVLPDTHPLAHHDPLRVAELFDDPWIVSAGDDAAYQAFALATRDRDGRPPHLGPTVNNIDEYLEAVLAGLGVGLAPASAARYYNRPGINYPAVTDAEPSVCALSWSTNAAPAPPAQAMIDVVRSHLPRTTVPT